MKQSITGKESVDKILIFLSLGATFLSLGSFIYTNYIFSRPLPIDEIEAIKLQTSTRAELVTEYFKIEKLLTNLEVRGTKMHYLDCSLGISPFKSEQVDKLEAKRPIILDSINYIAGHMTFSELSSLSGRLLFEERIKRKINSFYKRPVVKEIFFTRYVVQ